ncbi:glycosyltransferase [Belliella marina]|uniref:Glycosyltransferase n=1 Tax=Belliella marina TaxID=1644146 RepID=A0ABW4VL46_9BACT
MKILLFYINLNQGGVQRMMVNVANYFDQNGHEVSFYLAKKQGQYIENLNPGIKLYSADTDNRLKLLRKFSRFLKLNPHDTIFTAVPHFNLIAIMCKMISGSKVKLIISERSNTFQEFQKSPWGFYKISFFLIPFLYRFANEIVAVSKGVADDLAKAAMIPRSRITVVYNPAFNETMLTKKSEQVDHPWIKSPRSEKLLIAVGRLTPQKDFGTLITSMTHIDDSEVKLIIVGEGDELPKLQKLVASLGLGHRVDFAGFQLNPVAWIAKCDVFVLSSLWEGFGNILVEALATGTTIVSTNCESGPSEILDMERYGYLTPVGNPKSMAKTIQKALAKRLDESTQIARAKDFDVNHILKNYEVLFQSS